MTEKRAVIRRLKVAYCDLCDQNSHFTTLQAQFCAPIATVKVIWAVSCRTPGAMVPQARRGCIQPCSRTLT